MKISEQPFRLLAALLERPGETFTRQELATRLWPDGAFVGFEDSLNTAINKVRTALDDLSANPRFIETIPRRGYRFIAPVEAAGTNGRGQAAESAMIGGAGRAKLKSAAAHRLPARVVAGALVASAAFAFWWYTPLPPPRITHIDQVTLSSRIDTPVKLVPTADRVYYMERDGDHWNLMQTSIGGGDGRRVAIPASSGMAVDILPDEATLLLGTFEKRGDDLQLWTMPTVGGPALRLGHVKASSAAFTPDGKQIAYIQDAFIWIADASGANPRKLADLPAPASWLAWSPDGERLRFTMNPPGSKEVNSIWEISKDGTNLHRLLVGWSHPGNECCGAWTPDGRYFIFTSSHTGGNNLWAMRERGSLWRRSPRGPFPLTSGPNFPFDGIPGPGGRHIYFYNGVWHQEMERFELQTKQFLPFLANPHVSQASFSRDGQWIVYLDTQTGNLARSRADGTDPMDLAPSSMQPTFPRWAPDEKRVAFTVNRLGQPSSAFVVGADGGSSEPLLAANEETRDADWSSDGKTLVLSQATEVQGSGGYELRLVDFATRRTEKIPGSEGLAMCRWSPDGRFISATSAEQDQLKLWDVAARKWTVLAHGIALGISVWSPDSRYLYFQDLLGKGEALSRYDVQSRRIEAVMDFSEMLKTGTDRCALFGVTPDGSPIIGFNRGAYDLFAATASLP